MAAGNFVRLDGGYLALFGDQRSLVAGLASDGRLQVAGGGGTWLTASAGQLTADHVPVGGNSLTATGGL